MSRLVKPLLSEDQAKALISVAEDRVLEAAIAPHNERRAGDRDKELLAGAVARIKEALSKPE